MASRRDMRTPDTHKAHVIRMVEFVSIIFLSVQDFGIAVFKSPGTKQATHTPHIGKTLAQHDPLSHRWLLFLNWHNHLLLQSTTSCLVLIDLTSAPIDNWLDPSNVIWKMLLHHIKVLPWSRVNWNPTNCTNTWGTAWWPFLTRHLSNTATSSNWRAAKLIEHGSSENTGVWLGIKGFN